MSNERVQDETGVNRNVVQRLRSGSASDVKGATVERMRTFLAGGVQLVV
jgi:hypothetical protein